MAFVIIKNTDLHQLLYLHNINIIRRKKIQIYIFGFPYLSKLIVTQLISILYMEIKDSQRWLVASRGTGVLK